MNKILFTFIFGTVDYLSPPLYCTEIVFNSTGILRFTLLMWEYIKKNAERENRIIEVT